MTDESDKNTPARADGLTSQMGQARDAFEDYCAAAGIGRQTMSAYRSVVRRFLEWLDRQGLAVTEVSSQQVEQYVASLTDSSASRSAYRSTLRRFFDAQVARGILQANPAGRGRSRLSAPATDAARTFEPAPYETSLLPGDDMRMLIVHGFLKQVEILDECYGKDSSRYMAGMAKAKKALGTLFRLVEDDESSTTASERQGSENGGKPGAALPEVQAYCADVAPPNVLLSDELIRDRREEAARGQGDEQQYE
jgi:ribosomal protein S20